MLVLSRKVGEKLMIGDQITIVVSCVAGNRVTLGIDAPLEVPIMRAEIAASVQPAKAEAGASLETLARAEPSVPALAK